QGGKDAEIELLRFRIVGFQMGERLLVAAVQDALQRFDERLAFGLAGVRPRDARLRSLVRFDQGSAAKIRLLLRWQRTLTKGGEAARIAELGDRSEFNHCL